MRKLTVLSICVALVFCVSFTTSAMASDEEEIIQVLENSVKALNTLDTDLLNSCWLSSEKISMFGPEKTGAFLTQGWKNIGEGNTELTGLPEGTLNFSLHHPQVTMLGDKAAFTTGYLTLVYTDPETKAQVISLVRQTLIFQKVDGKWLVVHNHASMLPTE